MTIEEIKNNIGKRVIIDTKNSTGNDMSDYLAKNNIYFVNSEENRLITKTSSCAYVTTPTPIAKILEMQSVYQYIKYFTLLDESCYEKYDDYVEEFITNYNSYIEKNINLDFKHESFLTRNFNYSEKSTWNTNYNFVLLGKWNKTKDIFSITSKCYRGSCCSFTKTTNDLEVYIPIVWLQYYGYSTFDLISYLDFLTKCNIGFEYEYLGEKLATEFKSSIDLSNQNEKGEYFTIYQPWINKTNEGCIHNEPKGYKGFIAIRLKAATSSYLTYFRFIALRYIYNYKYWTIPGNALQIKIALGNIVSNFEDLLIAHLYMDYFYYYCFVYNTDNLKANPFQNLDTVLNNIPIEGTVNSSFAYKNNVYDNKKLKEFFDNKNWMGLYWYLKSKENA